MGDPNDFASWKERKILSSHASDLHETTTAKLGNIAEQDTNSFIREVIFMKNKTIGVITGNHKWDFTNKTNSDQRIATALNAKYLGDLAYIRIVLMQEGRVVNLDIVAHHGKAGGKTAGNTINQVDDLRRIFPIADIYLMGHDHKRGVWPESTLIVQTNHKNGQIVIKQKRQLLCRTGSFMRGYVDNHDSYVADRLLRPCELGTIKLETRVKRDRTGGMDSSVADTHGYV